MRIEPSPDEMSRVLENEIFTLIYLKGLTLGMGKDDSEKFIEDCNYIVDKRLDIFELESFNSKFYESDEIPLSEYFFPTFRKTWAMVYIKPPSLFDESKNMKLEIFKRLFDIDDFLNFFISSITKTKGCLIGFGSIDKTPEHLSLIVDDYISNLVSRVYDNNLDSHIRDIKINKLIR